MIKIGICDDDLSFCVLLEEMISRIMKDLKCSCEIEVYQSGLKFNDRVLDGAFDLLFIDIELQNIKGMTIGETVRKSKLSENVQIVYISSRTIYAMELFDTRPLNFLVKPIDYAKLERTLSEFCDMHNKVHLYFEFTYQKHYYRILLDSILYFESINKKIIIHMKDGSKTEFYGQLHSIISQVNNDFISIHQSYLVNYTNLKVIAYDRVVLINDERLNISQSKRQEVRKKILNLRRKEKK